MKAFHFCLVVLMATTATQATTITSCSTSNQFLRILESSNVIIFPRPKIMPKYCNGEWETYGGCCEVESLRAYVSIDKSLVETSAKLFLSSMEKLTGLVRVMNTILKPLSILPLIRQNFPLENALHALETLLNNNPLNNFAKCWVEDLAHYRGSSLCYACSGRNQMFFKGDKAMITPNACSTIVNKCKYSLNQAMELLKSFKILNHVVTQIRGVAAFSDKFKFAVTKVGDALDNTDLGPAGEFLRHMLEILEKNQEHNSDRIDAIKANLCRIVLRLYTKSALELLAVKFSGISDKIKDFVSERPLVQLVQNVVQNTAKPIGNWIKTLKSRHLELGFDAFEGDTLVIMAPTFVQNNLDPSSALVRNPNPDEFKGKLGQDLQSMNFP